MKSRLVAVVVFLLSLVAGYAVVTLVRNGVDATRSHADHRAPAIASPVDVSSPDEHNAAPNDSDLAATNMEVLVADAAERINAEVPIRIDPITTLTRATAHGNRIRYRYDVAEAVPEDRLRANRDAMIAATRRDVCRNPTDREIIDAGAQIEFAYYGPGDAYYFSTTVDTCDADM